MKALIILLINASFKRALYFSFKHLIKYKVILVSVLFISSQALAQTDLRCNATLSDVGQKVADALDSGNEWMLTTCNRLQGPPIKDKGDFLDIVQDEIENTRSRFALSTLAFSPQVNDYYLAPALARANALAKLASKKSAKPLFQFLVASDPTDIYDELTRNIFGKMYINVAVYQVGTAGTPQYLLNWNHAKLVIRDESVAYTGSQNMNTMPQNTQEEVSIGFYGDTAPVALRQFNRLVDVAQDAECSWSNRTSTCKDLPDYPPALVGSTNEATPVFSVDRGDFGLFTFDFQADKTISAAINAAQKTLDLSQHGYTYLGRTSNRVKEELAHALLRGVEIRSMVASAWGNSGDPYDQYVELLTNLYYLASVEGFTNDETYAADCRLHFAVMQSPLGGDARNHAKYFMVDDTLFYLGSQNLYPGSYWSLIGQDIAGLYEHGFIVDDATVADTVKQSYWTPKWKRSKAKAMISPYLPSDYVCPPWDELAELSPTVIITSGTLEVGETILFDSGVANTGTISSGTFNVKWLVDGQEVGAYGNHQSLAAGETQLDGNSAYSWVAELGEHTITFIVDVDNHVDELYETNNEITTTVTIGDGNTCQMGQLCVTTPFEAEVWTFDTGQCDGNANDSGTTIDNFIALGPFPEYCYSAAPDSFAFSARACDQSPPLCSLYHLYNWPTPDAQYSELTEADFTVCPVYECQNYWNMDRGIF